jgi:hydrogenase maturation factor HypF (carbamoyltransferase family)
MLLSVPTVVFAEETQPAAASAVPAQPAPVAVQVAPAVPAQPAPVAVQVAPAAQPTPAAQEILATVDGQAITAAEIEQSIKGQMLRIDNQVYSVKKQAVDALITNRLLDKEATKLNISRAELLKQEVAGKVEAVTDTEVEEFYTKNKARMGNKPLEEMKARVSQHLTSSKNTDRQKAFTAELRKAADVKINLLPPIMEVAVDGSPAKGPAQAPVTLVEFSDYQ